MSTKVSSSTLVAFSRFDHIFILVSNSLYSWSFFLLSNGIHFASASISIAEISVRVSQITDIIFSFLLSSIILFCFCCSFSSIDFCSTIRACLVSIILLIIAVDSSSLIGFLISLIDIIGNSRSTQRVHTDSSDSALRQNLKFLFCGV